jgi:hypothetical protein
MSTSCLFFKVQSVRPQLQKHIRNKEISRKEHSGFFSWSPLTKKKIFNIDNRPEEAARAIETLKGYPIQNKRLGVAYARTHDREALKDTNLVRVLELVERFTLD